MHFDAKSGSSTMKPARVSRPPSSHSPMKDHGGEFGLPFREFFKLGVGSHIKLSDGTQLFKVSLPKDSWINGLGSRLSSFEVVGLIIDSYLSSRNPAFLINLEVASQ